MAKESYLRMGIDVRLKAKLQALAIRENRTLTNFVETELLRIVAATKLKRKSSMPPRKARAARLTMLINAALKDKLQKLACEDFRNLADFVESRLREIVFDHKAGRVCPVAMHEAIRKRLTSRQHPGAARLSMRINAELKAELRKLATEQHRTLTDFVGMALHQISAAPEARRRNLLPRRQARGAQITMRISTKLKDELQELANEQYRTLTDFVDIELRRAAAGRRANRTGPTRR